MKSSSEASPGREASPDREPEPDVEARFDEAVGGELRVDPPRAILLKACPRSFRPGVRKLGDVDAAKGDSITTVARGLK